MAGPQKKTQARRAIGQYTLGIYLIMFAISMCNTIQGTLLTDIIGHYDLKAAMQGSLSAYQSIGSFLALYVAAVAAGRVGKPGMMGLLSLLTVIAMSGAAMRPAFSVMALFYVVFGVAKGLTDITTAASIADLHDGRRTATSMGLLQGAFGIGGLTAPLLITQAKGFGLRWNEAYYVFVFVALAALTVYAFIYAKNRRQLAPYIQKPQAASLPAVRAWLRRKRSWFLLGAILCYAVYQIGYYLWINRYLSVHFDNDAMGALALSLYWIGTAAARIFAPHLKRSAVSLILLGNMTALVFSLIGIWSMNVPVIVVCSLIAGLGSGAGLSLLLYIGCAWLRENTMIVNIVSFLVFYIGQIASSPMVGAVSAVAGMPAGMTLATLFALFSSLFVLPLRKEGI